MQEIILDVQNVTKRFGGVVADDDVSFSIKKGEIVGLVGPNGCGKSTLFNCITGYNPPTKGKVIFNGQDITGMKPYHVNKKGIARTFQLVQLLPELTVLENVMVGAYNHTNSTEQARKEAEEILEFFNFPGLLKMRNSKAKNLTTVDKKLLEIARATATKPELLMLDEAMAGLNNSEINDALHIIGKLRESGMTIMIIEHIMEVIMNVSDKVVVMEAGKKLLEGKPEEVVADERVIRAYLGDGYHVSGE